MKILLVEDHDSTVRALARMLERRDYEVFVTKGADEAVEAIKFQKFDLVISDIGLPGKDGWVLLSELRQLQPGLRAIALTGYGREPDVEKSQKAGFDLHLTKPATMGQVEDAIKKLLGSNHELSQG